MSDPDRNVVNDPRGPAASLPRPRASDRVRQRSPSPRRRAWRAILAALAFACAAAMLAACGDDGTCDPAGVEYFPAGGVSESMRGARPMARLTLDHTVVTWLEAAGGHDGDVGNEDGVDEFVYHFEEPTQIRLSLDIFDEAPELMVLDGFGNEIAHVTAESGDAMVTMSGHHTLRLLHPRAGDATAEPIPVFLRPILPELDAEAAGGPATVGGPAQANPTDVATLKASKNCPGCNLAGMSWNACPGGVSLAGLDISHADFTGANLACLTFEPKGGTYSLLTHAIFDDAGLNQVTLRNVDVTDARFSGTTFEIAVFDGVIATATDFSNSSWANSVFGAATDSEFGSATGTGSLATGAIFRGAHFGPAACLSASDLVDADFSGATFDSTSSVHRTSFAGANLFNVRFDGTKFRHDASLPHCGAPPASCCTGSMPCRCAADLGCKESNNQMACVENQGGVTLSMAAVCQRPAVQEPPQGVTIQNTDLTDVSFASADLTNSVFASNTLDNTTDFSAAILDGVDFTREHLGRAVDLSGAFLSDTTNFDGAVLSDFPTSQRGVNLSCVVAGATQTGGCSFPEQTTQFMGASMQYAQLTHAGLTEANLEGTILDGANLVGARLNFTNLKGASLVGAHLGVDPGSTGAAALSGAYMINVDLTDADLRSVDLTGAHAYGAATDALFVRTLLDAADFTNAILSGAVFTDASLPAAVFNGAQLVNASFDGATLTNAKFDGAYLQGADFTTAKAVEGVSLSNAAVSTMLTSQLCTLIPPGSWMYMDQDGIPYTFAFVETMLKTDSQVTCPNGRAGPCTTGDSLCPLMSGPFPHIPPCVPSAQYCYENCLNPPCFKDVPDPTCPLMSNCP
jgi:uncharacterized protein YjbI with pentapeptide repeats